MKEINNYKLIEMLGEGAYGSVYKVKNIEEKEYLFFISKLNTLNYYF
jgi:serine/threonine protein kinase